MSKPHYYSPAIERFLVSVLYHEARRRKIPMTQLANEILKTSLANSTGWQLAMKSLIIEPSYQGSTQVAIVDYDKPICYLYEWSKAWHFQFANLAESAAAVVSAKAKVVLVRKITEFNPKEANARAGKRPDAGSAEFTS